MKVLVIGKGGREHALVWKLAQSPRAERVYCAPGNAGTAIDGVNVPIEVNDFARLIQFVKKEDIGLTVVGPEEPLTRGIVDAFRKEKLRIFGPDREAAQLEGSKVFAKNVMINAGVPTADSHHFDHPDMARKHLFSRDYVIAEDKHFSPPYPVDNLVEEGGKMFLIVYRCAEGARRFATLKRPEADPELRVTQIKLPLGPSQPCVVKADGLAAGKGVFVCDNVKEAMVAVERIMVKEEFGREAGRKVLIEKRLLGEELSVLALVSGRTIVTLPVCQDHKRAGDGDTGPNTGGMGAYCPAPLATAQLMSTVEERVFVPTVHAMKRHRQSFGGVLYAGLMVTDRGPKVLEYNVRFGDPECQPLLMRLKTDLLDVLEACVDERLEELGPLQWDERPSVCVVMASKGYPGVYEKGMVISGLAEASKLPNVKVFHAGTKEKDGRIVTDGGRVLGVTAIGDTLAEAQRRAYEAVAKIEFIGAFYRRDIGNHAILSEPEA